jgi:formylglycine-generating enzyme required for sulfatase activity
MPAPTMHDEGSPAFEPPPSTGSAGPGSEAERLLKKASPARLALKLGAFLVLLAGAAIGGWYGREAYRERAARNAPMARVPGATVSIGVDRGPVDEGPAHKVTLKAFEIDVHEVTVGAYKVCVKRAACTPPLKGDFCNWGKDGVDDHPINCVDWNQASAYCRWLDKRLPTEREWEYAAKGDDGRKYAWGAQAPSPKYVNVCGSECRVYGARRGRAWNAMYDYDDGFPTTAPVGSFPAGKSPFGLVDMAGNVWEWTSSPYCPYPAESCGNAIEFVMRGGGWTNHLAMNLEVTTRNAIGRTEAVEALGFRCAR